MRPARKAFTLIELLIVVAIIAILASIAVPNFLEAQTRAKVSRAQADMRSMTTAVEAYMVDYNYYPLNGVLNQNGSIQHPQASVAGPPAHKYLYDAITTPVAYISRVFEDPFVTRGSAPQPDWEPYYYRYFYTNLAWFARITEPSPPPVIFQKRDLWGIWIMAGAGPDGDRLDLSADLPYDPTNGTISDGDLIRGQARLGQK